MKRPNYIIFTDKDGTLDLNDKNLNSILMLIKKSGGMFIPITGRTVGDIIEELKRNNIYMPELIVGDNGANVYDTTKGEFVIKKKLNHDIVAEIIDQFLKKGGHPENLRFTDGRKIYTSTNKDVRHYYRKSNTVITCKDILDEARTNEDITKITLAGSKEIMQLMSEIVSNMDCWTDMDKTKFPTKESNNYRLDIAHKNINKGEAVKEIANTLRPKYGFICLGNGANDKAMFKEAIDSSNIVAIMEDSDPELIQSMREYRKQMKKGKVVTIPRDKNLANRFIHKWHKLFQQQTREKQIRKGREFRESLKLNSQNINSTPKRRVSKKPKKDKNIHVNRDI